MLPILLAKQTAWIIYISVSIGTCLLLAILFYFLCGLRKNREKKQVIEHVVIDEEFISKLLFGLGNLDNILLVSIDNGRLKFNVKDLDLIDTNSLKELSTSGVFITGNNVKLLFKYDSLEIKKVLIERGVKHD